MPGFRRCIQNSFSPQHSFLIIRRANPEIGIEGNLPKLAVGIFKITGISSPKNLLRFFSRGGPGRDRLPEDGIHLRFRSHIVGKRKSGKTAPGGRHGCVFGQGLAIVEPEPAAVEGKKGDIRGGFPAWRSQSRLVKVNGRLQVGHPQGDHANPGFHRASFCYEGGAATIR